MITAQLATIPSRAHILDKVVESLLPQVDLLFIVFNDLDLTPFQYTGGYLGQRNKIRATPSMNNRGDAEKFYFVEHKTGHIFTCDDDLIYPPDYVEKMIGKIEEYDRKAVITLHGRVLIKKRPLPSYYHSMCREASHHCLFEVRGDHKVTTGGTGVMAWHSDTLPNIKYSDFELPNMADIWMAKVCKEHGVDIIAVEHKEGWLQAPPTGDETIWDKHHNNDKIQTEIVNKHL